MVSLDIYTESVFELPYNAAKIIVSNASIYLGNKQ